ncbi:MAG: aspartate--tRNA(Asn) ligase [Chloroflexota bacterium]
MRIKTTECRHYVSQTVMLQGRIHALRQMGQVTFLIIRDGWGTAQAVFEGSNSPIVQLAPESIIDLCGVPVEMAQAPGGVEIQQPAVKVLVPITKELPVPLHKKEIKAGLPTLLEEAVLLNRHPQRRAIFRLAAGVMAGFRHYLNAQDFTEVQTPKLVESATESGSTVFELNYFGRSAYLAQSPQFYKQIMVGIFDQVYEVGPVFRAEPHNTSRHINEYVSLDVEFGYIENHFTVMRLVTQLLQELFAYLAAKYQAELEQLKVSMPQYGNPEVNEGRFPHIHFAESLELIWRETGRDVRQEPDLSPEDERWLGAWALERYGSDFLFVTGYPMEKRPFYTHPDPKQPAYSNSFDLLFRGTELITGGQRLHLYTDYLAALAAAGLSTEPFRHYLQAFEYGMPPHGGFAIGLERLIKQLVKLPNVKLATLFPRDMSRLSP